MAGPGESSAGTAGMAKPGSYDDCVPKLVDAANQLTKGRNELAWSTLYSKANVGSGDEAVKRSLRCAVYVYLAVNGTSPSGEYSGQIVSGKGNVLKAAEIPSAAGRYDVRRFMRTNAAESVEFFHATSALSEVPAIIAKCEIYEIRLSEAIALCDWLDGAPGLTPAERDCQARLKTYSLKRARAARGGHSVEDMRDERMDDAIVAQGSAEGSILPPSMKF